MEKIDLTAAPRQSGTAQKVRRAGMIPAVIYGSGAKTEHLEVPVPEFERVFRKAGESTLVTLNIAGEQPRTVIIHDTQRHYLTNKFQHIDFFEVNLLEKMTAKVPLVFSGTSLAVKANGGSLVTVIDEVEVECLPADLPHEIQVDISVLNSFSDSILVKDLKVPANVTVTNDAEETVAKVNAPRVVEAELSAPVVEDVSAVEVEKKEKPAEGEEPAVKK
jgi:large subunit ribosomal protein L25